MALGECRNAADMIRVLVSDENRGQVAGHEAAPREPRCGIADGETAVDQDPGRAGFDDEAVAFAAATQGGEAHLALRVT
jgi:hypothetical protein